MKRIPPLRRLLPFLALAASLQLTFAYYDPAVQRWITRDPIQEDGGANMYQALGSSRVGSVDPHGNDIVVGGGSINCLGYAMDFGFTVIPSGISMKKLLEQYGWSCKGPTKKPCTGKKGDRLMVVYIYDASGFGPGQDPWTTPWDPNAKSDFHCIRKYPDEVQWTYIPHICPPTTSPRVPPKPEDPDSYFGTTVPKQRYCCTKPAASKAAKRPL
jgi:hypothetical protein